MRPFEQPYFQPASQSRSLTSSELRHLKSIKLYCIVLLYCTISILADFSNLKQLFWLSVSEVVRFGCWYQEMSRVIVQEFNCVFAVADRLLAQRTVKYKDYKFNITLARIGSNASPRPSDAGRCKFSNTTDTSTDISQGSNTIRVCNIPTTVTKDMLQMYFENAKRSGGGDLKECTINSQKGKAFITFKDVRGK